jgi:polygalacturonase
VLKSHIHLELSKGALVQFSRDHSLYPIIEHGGHNGGYSPISPIYGYQLKDVSITGEGVLDGGGDSWRPVKKIKTTPGQWQALIASGGVLSKDKSIWWPSAGALEGADYLATLKGRSGLSGADYLPARDYMRPCMVYLAGCSRVLLQGVTFRNSPMFVLYPNHCTDLMLDRVNVYNDWWAQNGDGIDISACKRVILYRCTVNAGDDGICMKSSAGGSGSGGSGEADPALENVVIAACTVFRAHGGFVIGSNTDGGMCNVYVTACNYIGTDIGIRVKSNAGRGGLVHDIYIDKVYMKNIVHEAISFDTYYEDAPAGSDPNKKTSPIDGKTPIFRDFFLSRIYCDGAAKAISIMGLPQMPVSRIFFEHLYIRAAQRTTTKDAVDISMKDVQIDAP